MEKKTFLLDILGVLTIIILISTLVFILSWALSTLNSIAVQSHNQEMERLELEKEIALIEAGGNAFTLDDSMKINISEDKPTICEAYSDLTTVRAEVKTGDLYYFINNSWVREDILWNSCLYE